MYNGNHLPRELSLITRQKVRSTDIKLSKAQISEIIQSRGFLGSLLSKITGPLMKLVIPLAKKYFSFIGNYSCCFSN